MRKDNCHLMYKVGVEKKAAIAVGNKRLTIKLLKKYKIFLVINLHIRIFASLLTIKQLKK